MRRKAYAITAVVFVSLIALATIPYINLATQVKGILAVVNGGTGVSSAQGNGSKVQLSTGSTTNGDCAKFDSNGNVIDAGTTCLTSGGGTTGGGGAGGTGSVPYELTVSPDLIPSSPNAMDDEFNAANGTAANTSSLWNWDHQGTATAVQNNGELVFSPTVSASQNGEFLYQAAPGSSPWEFEAKVTMQTSSQDYLFCGLAVGDGTVYSSWGPWDNGRMLLTKWGNTTNIATLSNVNSQPVTTTWIKIKYDGTNLRYTFSYDGVGFAEEFSPGRTPASQGLGTITRVGIFGTNTNATALGTCDFHWFRRIL